MKAIEISKPGGPGVLRPCEREKPAPGKGEVLIRVHAAGVNRPDIMQRQGAYPPPEGASDLPGLEVAGVVEGTGDGVDASLRGEKVLALLPGGGYAEYAVADVRTVLPLPRGLTMAEGAGLPETYFTVWSNVFDRCRIEKGESLLVHGGSSGIGTAAIALARAMGSTVYVTAGTDEKCTFCRDFGADAAINYKTEKFEDHIMDLTNGRGVDVVLDMVGGDYMPRNIACMGREARLASIAFLRGPQAEVNIWEVMKKRLTLTGSTLRARDAAFKGAIARKLEENIWPKIKAGEVKIAVDKIFPLEKAGDAHSWLEKGAHKGKIILEVRTAAEQPE